MIRFNPRAVEPDDRFVVINKTTGKVVESSHNESAAQHAVDNLNDHEKRCGREPVYFWRER